MKDGRVPVAIFWVMRHIDPLPIEQVLPELRAALRSGTSAVLQAPPGAGKTTRVPARAAGGAVARGPPHRDAGAATAGGPGRGAPDGASCWVSGRRHRRIPRPSGVASSDPDPHRGRHRGHPDPDAPDRSGAGGVRPRHLRRVSRAQHPRGSRTRAHASQPVGAARGPARAGHVGHAGGRPRRRAAGRRARGDERRAGAIRSRSALPPAPTGRGSSRRWRRPSARRSRRRTATCWSFSRAPAEIRRVRRRLLQASPRTSSRCTATSPRTQQDRAISPEPAGRPKGGAGHLDRGDQPDHRGRARRGGRRPLARAPLLPAHRDDPARDGARLPRLGRAAARARRPAGARRLLSSLVAAGGRGAPGRSRPEILEADLAPLALELAGRGRARSGRAALARSAAGGGLRRGTGLLGSSAHSMPAAGSPATARR